MKYIMLEGTLGGMTRKVPIIFPDFMIHSVVATYVTAMLAREHNEAFTPVSAGSINVGGTVSGGSETLKLNSREADELVINTYDYTHGLV